MIVEGQKAIEYIPAGQTEMLPLGTDWQSRHTEAERRKAEIRGRIHKQTDHYQKTAKDYFRPAKPTPSIYDSNLKRVAVYTRVSTSSEEQISSIENQTLYYTKKIAETENWTLQNIYSDEGKSGTSLRRVRLRPNCNDPYEKEAQHPARQAKVERHDGSQHHEKRTPLG